MVEVYKSVGWMNHDYNKVSIILNNSTHIAIAKLDDNIIGFARALSDGVFNAAIYDVVVCPKYQKRGIAKLLLENLLAQFEDLSCIHLISTTGNEAFYKKIGFKKLTTGMAIYYKSHLEKEYTEG
ncbi:GNAT family N-acetyltransferase [Macrococcoides canis]|uniref:GNAT family N-acetyltransferase n=1 Tax=Macrococcoides canis TaxID=1855823 RepID=UPI001B8D39A5|nr:GNAT family N-acetyltransferase [Macrococcus canis]QUR94298.1 GNAT family N-acetyltransferase [Macrococcus canis]UTH07188.1 GNAT family N-acetyltransferase [Macrococcus canis]